MSQAQLIQQTARMDFEKIRRRAFLRRLFYTVTRRAEANRLIPLQACSRVIAGAARRTLPNQLVPIEQIRGTVNRPNDFDVQFNPLRSIDEERWMNMYTAFISNVSLPQVKLHRIGDTYFVEDGHHRISIARFLGQESIEATVTIYASETT
jgi:hypothetical protein